MKTGIIFLIHWAIVFVILVVYAFITHNTINFKSIMGVVLTSAIVSAILLLFDKNNKCACKIFYSKFQMLKKNV